MNMTFTTRRRLQRAGLISLIVVTLSILIWFCWIVWVERYMVYSGDGAALDFSLSANVGSGQIARPPSAEETVSIYVNEGSNAINTNTELTQISGYFIDTDTLTDDFNTAKNAIASLPADTAVMIELKNIWGSFFYTSGLENATMSTKLDTGKVDELIEEVTSRNLYAIALIPAFRDRYYFLASNSNTAAGLARAGKGYLWEDEDSCYWFNPTSAKTTNWLVSITEELKALGFDEVVFSEFRVPTSGSISFNEDANTAIATAAATLVSKCATESFAVSFLTTDPNFPMPTGGRCRLYLKDIGAKDAESVASRVNVPDKAINLVYVTNTNDTRYSAYSYLRPIATYGENG